VSDDVETDLGVGEGVRGGVEGVGDWGVKCSVLGGAALFLS
jgi:hypothetical protein